MEKEIEVGKIIQFHAERIRKGNPVKGVLKSVSDEWIEVELLKDIHGMANSWWKGELKSFRKILIHNVVQYQSTSATPKANNK